MKGLIEFLNSKGIPFEENVLGSRLCSFRVGGEVRLVIRPKDYEQVRVLFDHLTNEKIEHKLLGRGSNIIIDDNGYSGAAVVLSDLDKIVVDNDLIAAGAGASMFSLALSAERNGLSGLEFAHGIPGSVGGGVYMNAGAYGGEICQVLTACECYDKRSGKIVCLENADCDFSYRHSILQDNKDLIVLGAFFKPRRGDSSAIRAKMDEMKASRRSKQPLEYPSAGSTFKRPEGHFAGKLIEDAGLKGFSIGGAQVSEKHAGFIINRDSATASDIKKLIEHVKNEVNGKFGILLECEVEFI